MKTAYARLVPIMAILASAVSSASVHAQQAGAPPADIKWVGAPAPLPAGAQLAVVRGDLAKTGPLVLRLKFPAGYKLPPHSSPAIDRIVVVSGSFNLGSGDTFDDRRTIPMSAGYVHWPDRAAFYGFAQEETVLEFQGTGPWAVKTIAAAVDPVGQKK